MLSEERRALIEGMVSSRVKPGKNGIPVCGRVGRLRKERYPRDNTFYIGDNLEALGRMKSESVDMVYLDPLFVTESKRQALGDPPRIFGAMTHKFNHIFSEEISCH